MSEVRREGEARDQYHAPVGRLVLVLRRLLHKRKAQITSTKFQTNPKSQITKIQTYTSKMVACGFICWRGGARDKTLNLREVLAQVSAGYRSCFHARTIHEIAT